MAERYALGRKAMDSILGTANVTEVSGEDFAKEMKAQADAAKASA